MQHHRIFRSNTLLPFLLLLALAVLAPLAQLPLGTPVAQAAPLAQSGTAANVGIAAPGYGNYSYLTAAYAETLVDSRKGTSPAILNTTKGGVSTALTLNQLGSVYGLAYDNGVVTGVRRVFIGAFARRFTSFGPGGPGAIYQYNLNTGGYSQIATVPGVTVNGHSTLYPGLPSNYRTNYDNWMQPWVGRSSLGDLEMGPGGSYLYVTDLQNRRVLAVNMASGNPNSTWQVLYQSPGNRIPFAIRFAPAINPTEPAYLAIGEIDPVSLHAYVVFRDSTNGSLWTAIDQDLHDSSIWPRIQRSTEPTAWYPWEDLPDQSSVFRPMPLLSGLAFTINRQAVVLGFRDRFADQYKQYDSGENLRDTVTVYATGDTLTYRWNGSAYALQRAGFQNPPDSDCGNVAWPAGSDYFRDSSYFNGNECQQPHAETHMGAVQITPNGQQWPPNEELVTTALDPLQGSSSGVAWFNVNPYQRDATAAVTAVVNDQLWKSATLGDITPLADFAYLGARAWNDANANGVQDAGEAPIANVVTELIDTRNSTVVSSAKTGADGWVYFVVQPNVSYIVHAAQSNWNAGGALVNMRITTPDQGGNDTTDSDLNSLDGTLLLPGQRRDQTNTTIGMGFLLVNNAPNTIGDRVWLDTDADGTQDTGEPNVNGSQTAVQIRLNCVQVYPSCPAGYPRSLSLGSGGTYQFGNLPAGIYYANFTPPSGTLGSPPDRGGNDALDSDGYATSGRFDTTYVCVGNPNVGCPINNPNLDQGLLGGIDLQITKTGPATAPVGTAIQYTLTYRNNSTISVPAGAVVQDTLPTGLTFVSASPAASSTSGSTRSWTLGALAAGASGTITINATVNTNAPTSVTNTATIAVPTGQTDTTPGNNSSSVTTTILYPDIQITKSGPATAAVGANIQYTLTYRNNSTFTVPAGSVVADTLPAGLTFVSASPAATSTSGSTRSWTLGALAAGTSGTITINATVATSAPASVSNTGTIAVPSGYTDSTPGNNSSTVTTTIQRPDVSVVKTGPATALVSDTITYQITWRNIGTAPAASVVVRDTLPAGLSYVSASPAPSSVSGQTLIWNLGTQAAGASGTISVQAQVLMSAPVSLVNTAQVSTTSLGDPNTSNDTSTWTTTVLRPNVRITKTAPANTAELSQLQYTLAYANNGTVAAANVVVRDTLPAGLSYVSANPSPSSVSGQTLTWNLGTLNANQSGSIVITTRVAAGTGGSNLDNTATIQTSTPGDDPSDNTSTTSTYVIPPPPPPAPSTNWKLAIRSTLDPLSQDGNPTNGVYVSNDSNVHWPAGEVLDWTPRAQISLPGASPVYPYQFRSKIVGWSYVSTNVESVERGATEADDMPGHGAGCRAGDRSGVDGAGLDGCVYRYIGSGALNDTSVPTENDMNGQAHGYWSVGVPRSMRNDVYTYSLSQLGAVKLTMQVKVVIETYNVEDPTGQTLRTRTDTPSNTYTLTLVVPRDLK